MKPYYQRKGWKWLPGMSAIWAYDETDDNAPLTWRCHETPQGFTSCGPKVNGAPEHNRDSIPDLTDAATQGAAIEVLKQVRMCEITISITPYGVGLHWQRHPLPHTQPADGGPISVVRTAPTFAEALIDVLEILIPD